MPHVLPKYVKHPIYIVMHESDLAAGWLSDGCLWLFVWNESNWVTWRKATDADKKTLKEAGYEFTNTQDVPHRADTDQ